MFNRPNFGMSVSDNPLLDSPYCQQEDIGTDVVPPIFNYLLLTDGTPFLLTDGTGFLLT